MAGRKAFRMAIEKVKPVLLEPVMNVEITAPQEASGDILGDVNSRRGRVQGMDTKGSQSVVKAQVPLSEMLSYQSTLNSITGARGRTRWSLITMTRCRPSSLRRLFKKRWKKAGSGLTRKSEPGSDAGK